MINLNGKKFISANFKVSDFLLALQKAEIYIINTFCYSKSDIKAKDMPIYFHQKIN